MVTTTGVINMTDHEKLTDAIETLTHDSESLERGDWDINELYEHLWEVRDVLVISRRCADDKQRV